MRTGIIAALPGELKPLVRGWRRTALQDGTRIWTLARGEDVWIAACSGMGADAARRAFAGAEIEGGLDMVMSVGWAGALVPDVQPGKAYVLSSALDAQTGEQFQLTDGKRKLRLVTAARVADADEKARLRRAYLGAVMVDMEAATVARMAQMRGIPCGCIKGVSDGFGARLPDINPFITSGGKLRLIRFVVHVGLRPWHWAAMIELGRNAGAAAKEICTLILKLMEEKNVDRLNRTGTP